MGKAAAVAHMDAHVHSRFSDRPSEWFLQRLGAAESYTDPDAIFSAAKSRGMDFVTLTDHNRIEGALYLKRRYPAEVVLGVEVTTYFPEDGCKVHLLLYGINGEQFDHIQTIRSDIYVLREYVRAEDIAHSVAHATYSINERLTADHVEKLIVLFDVFEVVNGSRDRKSNETLTRVLDSLDEAGFAGLCRRHRIEPFGSRSWIKGRTGGSDDHAGILAGRTYTVAAANSPEEFVEAIRSKRTTVAGRHNDHRTLAFAIYKIACDFMAERGVSSVGPLVEQLNAAVFEPGRMRRDLFLRQKRALGRFRGNRIADIYLGALQRLKTMRKTSVEDRLDVVFDAVCDASDEVVSNLVLTVSEELKERDLGAVASSVSSAIPAAFLAVPFLSTMQHMNRSRELLGELASRFGLPERRNPERVLWFSDTLDDLNGVSVTLGLFEREARRRGIDLRLVTTTETPGTRPERLELAGIARFALPYYEPYELTVPSLLRSLEIVHDLAPSRIYVSTPGPTGLVGMFAARLLGVPCHAVYHTDFTRQAERLTEDGSASGFMEPYVRWFYSLADEIRVPSQAYVDELVQRGFDPRRMRVFRRGVDSERFAPDPSGKAYLAERYGVGPGPVLLYTGRLSHDKGIDFLLRVVSEVRKLRPETWLVIAGDGPQAESFTEQCAHDSHIVFTGRLDHSELPRVVAGCDALLFPSTTDTFGMSVLEAQAAGVPAIVSDVGGPREIVVDGVTGFVLAANDLDAWVSCTLNLLEMRSSDRERFETMARSAVLQARSRFGWDDVFRDLCEIPPPAEPRTRAIA